MASVRRTSPARWLVHLASQSPFDSEVTVELRMSRALADNLARIEAYRVRALDLGRDDEAAEDVGSAILGVLSAAAAIERVKERVAAFDQREVMDLIDREVAAERACRP